MTILPTLHSILLLLPLISDGLNSNVLEVQSGSDAIVHKNIYKVVIGVAWCGCICPGETSPFFLRAAAHFVGRLAALQGPLWGRLHSLCPSGTSIIFGFPFQNAFHKSHFLVSHYSMLREFRLKHAANQIHIWCKSASSCYSQWNYKTWYPWRILPMNSKQAFLVERKWICVFWAER